MLMPRVFAYYCVQRSGAGAAWQRRMLLEAARREGLAVAQVFVDVSAAFPRPALDSLVEAVAHDDVRAVLVPAAAHLAGPGDTDRAAVLALQERTGLPVIIAGPVDLRLE